MLKMSVMDNQKDLQESTAKLAGNKEAFQKIVQEMGCSTKEASATTEKLTNIVTFDEQQQARIIYSHQRSV